MAASLLGYLKGWSFRITLLQHPAQQLFKDAQAKAAQGWGELRPEETSFWEQPCYVTTGNSNLWAPEKSSLLFC